MYLLNSDGYALGIESLWYNSRLSIFGWREWRGVRTGRVWNQNKEEEIQTEAETEASKQTETPVDSLSVWQNREGKRKALTSKMKISTNLQDRVQQLSNALWKFTALHTLSRAIKKQQLFEPKLSSHSTNKIS